MYRSNKYKTKRLYGYSQRHLRRLVKQKTENDYESLSRINDKDQNEQSTSNELIFENSNENVDR